MKSLLFIAAAQCVKFTNLSELEELPYGDHFHADYSNFPGTKDFAPSYERKMPE